MFDLSIAFLLVFCINFTLSTTFAIVYGLERKPQNPMNKIILSVYVSSAIWSFGCGLMCVQTEPIPTYIFRYIGILGCFLFMMSVQKTMCTISEISKKHQVIVNGISYTGLFVWIAHIISKQTVFVRTIVGTTFFLKSGIITVIYSLYFTIVCIDILLVTIYTLKRHKLQRVRVYAKSFIIVESLVFIGAILDMVLPVFQIPAWPGSAITHFWGVFVFWFAIRQMRNSQITVSNMSEYIYYSLAIPVLVFDSKYQLQIINEASAEYLDIPLTSDGPVEYYINDFFESDSTIFDFEGNFSKSRSRSIKANATCDIDISKITNKFDDIIGYICIINDLTEHEMVINQLEEAKLASDAANMSKSLFLANMSHEIRTPMNAILGFSEIALSENIDKTSREYFTNIKQAGDTLLTIINDILNISKIELGKQELNVEAYYPAKIINDVQLIISVAAVRKNLDLSINIDENLPSVLRGDKDKIREILINLLNNSVKYTESGRIGLDVKVVSSDGNKISIQFAVSDTGIGIKKEALPLIFDKFQRVDNNFNSATEGTGLGLSITKGIVELMGGEISVESIVGIGSTFTVTIPQEVVDSTPYTPIIEEQRKEESEEEKNKTSLPAVKILSVDDNKANQMVIKTLLRKLGLDFDLAYSGYEAFEKCKCNQYAMILMDQMMPGMDGIETLKEIRRIPAYSEGSNTKMIALTANIIQGVRENLLANGFDQVMGKPINIRGFERMLRDEL